jgi:hypothetical protein
MPHDPHGSRSASRDRFVADPSDLLPQPSGPRPTEQQLLATIFQPPRSLASAMADSGSICNVQPRDQPFFSIQELRRRGWSRSMVNDLLGVEDRLDPVDHRFNFSGRKMYALRSSRAPPNHC